MTDIARSLNLIEPMFDVSVSKRDYMACSLRLVNLWWGSGVALLVTTASNRLPDPHAMGSLATLLATVLLLPLVENAVYLLLIDLISARNRAPLRVSFIAALAATLLHSTRPPEALFLLGAYFFTAAVYLAWRHQDRSFGFWFGVGLHGLFNLPTAVLGFLG
ncbi:MAG TPA: hypothetical protein VGV37_01210 [Aliidongia sp.]|uniref:hypothetical protein n=1 Tax=Aliidongia sp. TaxID=1914230 RepID=UPI002DDD49E2|nr:hypothetical protein [Aliidongia sp.]HEV2673126.1 hypothetical protein [Aliidongia sp.]